MDHSHATYIAKFNERAVSMNIKCVSYIDGDPQVQPTRRLRPQI